MTDKNKLTQMMVRQINALLCLAAVLGAAGCSTGGSGNDQGHQYPASPGHQYPNKPGHQYPNSNKYRVIPVRYYKIRTIRTSQIDLKILKKDEVAYSKDMLTLQHQKTRS